MSTETYTIKYKRYDASDPRLGRHVRHDSRSKFYRMEAANLSSLTSIRHQRYIPTLDQLQLGSCVGNASVGVLGTGFFWNEDVVKALLSPTDAVQDESVAVHVYSASTQIDPYTGAYPPVDTGTDGLSAAKVLCSAPFNLISGYLHAFSLEAALTALAVQPIMIGTEWRGDMFNPQPDGRIQITGSVEGGHEYELDELDVENKRVWIHNSWNDTWGVQGRAYLTWDDLGTLLAADGDCTIFIPKSVPAPIPTPVPTPPEPAPVPPTPGPEPTPTPDPEPVPDPSAQFLAAVDSLKHSLDDFVASYVVR